MHLAEPQSTELGRVPLHDASGSGLVTGPDGPASGLLFSVVLMPATMVPSAATRESIATLLRQSHASWEAWLPSRLCDGVDDGRLRLMESSASESDAQWFNRMVRISVGDYIVPIPAYARLADRALERIAHAVETSSEWPDLVYSDEEFEDPFGYVMRQYKPGWDPELMLGRDAVGHLRALRAQRVRDVGGADDRLPASAAYLYDLALRVAAMPDSRPAHHLAEVLCTTTPDLLQSRALDGETMRTIVAAHLERLGHRDAEVEAPARAPGWSRVRWPLPEPPPRVSVIVPTRDQPAMLARCADGVLYRTDYTNLELLIVDNGSVDPETALLLDRLALDERVRILRDDSPFNFSTLNNLAVSQASGSVLVLLNDDTEVIESDWLNELSSQALRDDVGMVGARLLFPDDRVQHAGLVMVNGGVHHQFRFADADDLGPAGELALTRSVSGVTGACVALRRSVFEEVRGMDESFAVAYGDVDLCLRISARGYRLICSPYVELYHHESATRGYEDTPAKKARHDAELELLRQRWHDELWSEPFANRYLLQIASQVGGHAEFRSPVRRGRGPGALLASLARRAKSIVQSRASAVIPNPLFSASWYVARYPEVGPYRLGPYRHFRRHGARESRDPNPLFDTRWYLDHNPDVAASGTNPLDHYLKHGAREGRDPGPRFSTNWYLSAYADVRASGENPLLHYLRHGRHEGRTPHP